MLLKSCGQDDLFVLIESSNRNWSFIYDLVQTININISATPTQHAIPFGTTITDHINRQMDTLSITGLVSCYKCGSDINQTSNDVVRQLKKLSERLIYQAGKNTEAGKGNQEYQNELLTITSNDWQFKYAMMTSVTINESQDRTQIKTITTNWTGLNLVGTVRTPTFQRGGIQYG